MRKDIDVATMGNNDPRLYGNDQSMKIYYDETNNIRKLLLTDNGLNVEKHDNFVLGGIFIKSNQDIGEMSSFREKLRIQKSAAEIKFDLVAKGNFESILNSRKLEIMFSWLLERDIGIHYTNLNILNWAILDIIESIVATDEFHDYLPAHLELKNELYRIVASDLKSFLSLLRSYNYPDIAKEDTFKFLGDVIKFIDRNWPQKVFEATKLLNSLLRSAQSLPELVFLVDEKSGVLIDSFSHIYLNRICTFKNSSHVFDKENEVEKRLSIFRIMNGINEVPFSFADSKTIDAIQFSDVIVGFLGKYFTFIEKTPPKVLLKIRRDLSITQSTNLKLFRRLILLSDNVSNALLHRVTTMDSDWKSDAFIHGVELPPHLLM